MTKLESRPVSQKGSLHPSITEEQISNLVEDFYGEIAGHEYLGPIFDKHIAQDWDHHLKIMKTFWRSVLLRSGEYKGKPVPVHQRIEGIDTGHFTEWLRLFSAACSRCFSQDAALIVDEAAQKIATSLWLSRSSDPFVTPPVWSDNKTAVFDK